MPPLGAWPGPKRCARFRSISFARSAGSRRSICAASGACRAEIGTCCRCRRSPDHPSICRCWLRAPSTGSDARSSGGRCEAIRAAIPWRGRNLVQAMAQAPGRSSDPLGSNEAKSRTVIAPPWPRQGRAARRSRRRRARPRLSAIARRLRAAAERHTVRLGHRPLAGTLGPAGSPSSSGAGRGPLLLDDDRHRVAALGGLDRGASRSSNGSLPKRSDSATARDAPGKSPSPAAWRRSRLHRDCGGSTRGVQAPARNGGVEAVQRSPSKRCRTYRSRGRCAGSTSISPRRWRSPRRRHCRPSHHPEPRLRRHGCEVERCCGRRPEGGRGIGRRPVEAMLFHGSDDNARRRRLPGLSLRGGTRPRASS